MEEKHVYPNQFYKVKEGDITVDNTLASKAIKGKNIARWTIKDEDPFKSLNLGTPEDPRLIQIAKDLGEYEARIKKTFVTIQRRICIYIQGHERDNSVCVQT